LLNLLNIKMPGGPHAEQLTEQPASPRAKDQARAQPGPGCGNVPPAVTAVSTTAVALTTAATASNNNDVDNGDVEYVDDEGVEYVADNGNTINDNDNTDNDYNAPFPSGTQFIENLTAGTIASIATAINDD